MGRKISNYVWRLIDFSLTVYLALYRVKTSLERELAQAGIPLTFNKIATTIQLLRGRD